MSKSYKIKRLTKQEWIEHWRNILVCYLKKNKEAL